MSFAKKIKDLMATKKLTQIEIAKLTKINQATISMLTSGKSEPTKQQNEKFAELAGLKLQEWEYGTVVQGKAIPIQGGDGANDNDLIIIDELDIKVSAGHGAIIESEELKSSWPFPKSYAKEVLGLQQGNASIVEVRGDSMEPTLYAGDRIIVNQLDDNPSQPGIFVIFDGGETVVKRIERIPHGGGGQVKLISDNPLHGDYIVDAEAVKIIGRVACIIRKV